MFNRKSSYALNKKDPNAIVYMDANEAIIRLTREDFASEEEFLKWKSLSDADYHASEKEDHVYANHIAAAFAKVKAHFMFRNVEVMAQLRDALTDKILIFGYLEQADTPFPIYTIICKYCNINRGRAFSIDVSVFE